MYTIVLPFETKCIFVVSSFSFYWTVSHLFPLGCTWIMHLQIRAFVDKLIERHMATKPVTKS